MFGMIKDMFNKKQKVLLNKIPFKAETSKIYKNDITSGPEEKFYTTIGCYIAGHHLYVFDFKGIKKDLKNEKYFGCFTVNTYKNDIRFNRFTVYKDDFLKFKRLVDHGDFNMILISELTHLILTSSTTLSTHNFHKHMGNKYKEWWGFATYAIENKIPNRINKLLDKCDEFRQNYFLNSSYDKNNGSLSLKDLVEKEYYDSEIRDEIKEFYNELTSNVITCHDIGDNTNKVPNSYTFKYLYSEGYDLYGLCFNHFILNQKPFDEFVSMLFHNIKEIKDYEKLEKLVHGLMIIYGINVKAYKYKKYSVNRDYDLKFVRRLSKDSREELPSRIKTDINNAMLKIYGDYFITRDQDVLQNKRNKKMKKVLYILFKMKEIILKYSPIE